ncbi:MAG: hypothetical protein HYT03_01225 [Candidatus Harrisonbacteria bacterium]|nr:hypothetical protein [Candidatus Harrisonbacteria bacterium]
MNKLLWKIYTIWFLRRILPLILIQVAVLIIVLKLLAGKIFLGKIIENASIASDSNIWEFAKYLLGAFLQTNIAVQIFIMLILSVGALILRDLGRAMFSYLKTFQK